MPPSPPCFAVASLAHNCNLVIPIVHIALLNKTRLDERGPLQSMNPSFPVFVVTCYFQLDSISDLVFLYDDAFEHKDGCCNDAVDGRCSNGDEVICRHGIRILAPS